MIIWPPPSPRHLHTHMPVPHHHDVSTARRLCPSFAGALHPLPTDQNALPIF